MVETDIGGVLERSLSTDQPGQRPLQAFRLFYYFSTPHHSSLIKPEMSDSETPQFEYVTLVSGDGFEFIVPRSTACVSGTIRRMLDPSSQCPAFAIPIFLEEKIR